MTKNIKNGQIHKTPNDLKKIIISKKEIVVVWNNLTPLARNEWICWIESAKKIETRVKRINQAFDNLTKGKKRPCCWPGCPHR